MTIDEIVEYVLRTPHNTNRAILTEMLKQLAQQGQGGEDEPGIDVIYDGGKEN